MLTVIKKKTQYDLKSEASQHKVLDILASWAPTDMENVTGVTGMPV